MIRALLAWLFPEHEWAEACGVRACWCGEIEEEFEDGLPGAYWARVSKGNHKLHARLK